MLTDIKSITPIITSIAVNILLFLAIFITAYIIAQISRKITKKILLEKLEQKAIATFFSDLLFYILIIVGLTVALSTTGVNVNAIIAGLGLGGFALGFALKDIIGNFISGLMILLTKPIKIGDSIKISGFEGTVESINLRHTTIRSVGKIKEKILIPNNTIFSSITVIQKEKTKTKS
ncbi:MAG TPA: mechanosensitive ion channel domain-containing protein [Candidatus Paceibacterota bacterium]